MTSKEKSEVLELLKGWFLKYWGIYPTLLLLAQKFGKEDLAKIQRWLEENEVN